MSVNNFKDDGRWAKAFNWGVAQRLGYQVAGEFAAWAVRMPVGSAMTSLPQGYRMYRRELLEKELDVAVLEHTELGEKILRLQKELDDFDRKEP